MNILAIDYGTRRIGLAWVETGLGVVLPYGIVQNEKGTKLPKELLDIIKTDQPEQIVLGLPMSTKDISVQTANETRVREFGTALENESGVAVDYIDERFSSQQADNTPGDVSRDEKSAMIILESFIGKKKQ
jgi:putative Holliday junction resolvase